MITRRTMVLDRLAVFGLALAAMAGGLAALWWWSGRTIDGRTLPTATDTSALRQAVGTTGFAWAAAAVGVILALLGLRWLAAHLTGPGSGGCA